MVRHQMVNEPVSLDPHKIDGLTDFKIAMDLFEGLTTLSADDRVMPGAAASWESSADGLTWTFHLRPDAVWSDGTPVTTADFVYSFRRAIDPATASPYVISLLPITGAEAINAGIEKDPSRLGVAALDPLTLRITLAQPTPWFLALLTTQSAMPVPRRAVEAWGDKWIQAEHIVVNGPFTLRHWLPLGDIDLVRNPKFHDAASVGIDEIDYVLAEDNRAALRQYRGGELDTDYVLGPDLPAIRQERPGELRTSPLLATAYLVVNQDRALGADPRVRRALALVIDREVLERDIIRRGQRPGYELVPPGMPGYTVQRADWADQPMAERIAEAQALWRAAGAAAPSTIHLLTFKQDVADTYLRAITSMWRKALGVETEIETIEARVFEGRLTHHDFEISLYNWYGDYADPWTFLANFRSDAQGLNVGNYRNPAFDALLERSRGTADPAARMALLEEAERLLEQDQTFIPIMHHVAQYLVNPRVQGWLDAPLNVHPDRYLSVTDAAPTR